jgi:hypothetical protein
MVANRDAWVAVFTVLALAAVGVLLGLVWWRISPARPPGYVIDAGIIPGESESFVAGDGRFAILTALAGIIAALILWSRVSWRGPVALVALALGSVVGALCTAATGRLLGGGHASGKSGTTIEHLPLQLHATALLALEAFLAVLCYGALVLFSSRDDLGRAPRVAVGYGSVPNGPVPNGSVGYGSVGNSDDL